MRSPRRSTSLFTGGALLAGAATAGVALAPAASASTLTVSNTNNAGAGSLRQAIIDANASAGADTIVFSPSVTGTITLSSDLEHISGDVSIVGPGSDKLTIAGAGGASGFVQTYTYGNANTPVVPASTINLTISGLTLTGLRSPAGQHFGAIGFLKGTATVRDVIVTNSGGGVTAMVAPVVLGAVPGEATSVTIDRVQVRDNIMTASDMRSSGSISAVAEQLDVTELQVVGNESALFGPTLAGMDRMTIRNSVISGNRAAFYATGYLAGNNVSISGSTFDHNTSTRNVGLMTGSKGFSGAFTLSDSSISDNTSVGASAIFLLETTEFDRVTVTGNTNTKPAPTPVNDLSTAATAPTFYGTLAFAGRAIIDSSTITDNNGAGILLAQLDVTSTGSTPSAFAPADTSASPSAPSIPVPTPSLQLSHSTVANNSGAGAVQLDQTTTKGTTSQTTTTATATPSVVLDHSIVAGNGGTTKLDIALPFTARFSLVQKPFATHTDGAGGGNVFGVDPQLQPLTWYSRTGAVRPILWGSPAWNTGDPAFTPPPATDQTGAPREVEIIDMGAYEVQTTLDFAAPKFTG